MTLKPRFELTKIFDKGNPKVVENTMYLEPDEWHAVPTGFADITDAFEIFGPELHDVAIKPGKNVQIDILYDGRIELHNAEPSPDYEAQNPIFNSQSIKHSSEGNYRFQTLYPASGFSSMPLSEAVALTAQHPEMLRRMAEVDKNLVQNLKGSDDLETTLRAIYEFVRTNVNAEDSQEEMSSFESLLSDVMGLDSFSDIYHNFVTKGNIPAHCIITAKFTAGLINACGLEARVLNGGVGIDPKNPVRLFGREVSGWGHSFAEAFIPSGNSSGFWVPVDPAVGHIMAYPSNGDQYYFSAELPKFSDVTKKAQIRISYV